MNTLNKRIVAAAAGLVVAGVAAYWYWSPYLAVRELRSAAMAADAGRFNEHVDFPSLRESLKGQFSERIGREGAGNAFGGMLAQVLADKMIDAAVRPETVMFAMREGKFRIEPSARQDGEAAQSEHNKVHWSTERQGFDTVLFHAEGEGGNSGNGKMALVMRREGFAHWKLTDIRLPD
jgi:hypothetical protein